MNRERISDASVIVPVSRSKLWAEIFQHPPTEQPVKCVKVDRTQKGEKRLNVDRKFDISLLVWLYSVVPRWQQTSGPQLWK